MMPDNRTPGKTTPGKATPGKMTAERVERLLEAYGANPARWPSRERDPALALLKADPQLERRWQQALRLDLVLDRAGPPQPGGDLLVDIEAIVGVSGWRQWTLLIWPFGPIWKPALGLTMAAAIGIALGLAGSGPAELVQITSEIEGLILG